MILLVNIDVEDLDRGTRFYCEALGLRVGRRFDGWVELVGTDAPVYLLPKPSGTAVSPVSDERRDYRRHWTPVHLDFAVEDVENAVNRAIAAGATLEGDIQSFNWGRLATLSDPFGHGFCLLQFAGNGYEEVA